MKTMRVNDYLLNECEILENKSPTKTDDNLDVSQYSFLYKSNPKLIVENIKEIILIIDRISISRDDWPTVDEWKKILPRWFTSKFLPDRTEAEKKKFILEWDSADVDRKSKIEMQDTKWRLKNWIYYFETDKRDYFIENIEIMESKILLTIASIDLPFSIGPIEWLIRASGGYELVEVI